jgi:hypothetical protein
VCGSPSRERRWQGPSSKGSAANPMARAQSAVICAGRRREAETWAIAHGTRPRSLLSNEPCPDRRARATTGREAARRPSPSEVEGEDAASGAMWPAGRVRPVHCPAGSWAGPSELGRRSVDVLRGVARPGSNACGGGGACRRTRARCGGVAIMARKGGVGPISKAGVESRARTGIRICDRELAVRRPLPPGVPRGTPARSGFRAGCPRS